MNAETTHVLSNDFQAVRLFSLHTWPDATHFQEIPGQGPYVVIQTGVDPESLTPTVEDFILGRMGRWLPMYLFHQLAKDLRREQFIFSGAAEVIEVLQGLIGKPRIERGTQTKSDPLSPEDQDPFEHAIREALERGAIEEP